MRDEAPFRCICTEGCYCKSRAVKNGFFVKYQLGVRRPKETSFRYNYRIQHLAKVLDQAHL